MIKFLKEYGLIEIKENKLFKYQIGPFPTKNKATDLFNKLKNEGHEVLLVEYSGNTDAKIIDM